jgi:hypothetical protein
MPTETLSKEIEAAVEQVVTETNEDAKEQETEEVTSDTTAETEGAAGVAEETEETEETAVRDEMGAEVVKEAAAKETTEPATPKVSDDDTIGEPSVPELSDEILSRAIGAGMTLTDALSFPDEAALDRVLSVAEQAAKPADQKGTAAVEDPFAELKLDPEKYEPEVVEMMDRVTKVLKNQHEQIQNFKQTQQAFEQKQEEAARAGQMAAAQEIEQWFDKQVEGLGEDFADALGTGGYLSLDRGSSQFAKRSEIADQMSVLMAGYQAQGLDAPPREEVFNAAAGLVLRDEHRKVHEKKLAGDLEKRASQHIQRAGGSKGTTAKTPEEEVAQALQEKFGI